MVNPDKPTGSSSVERHSPQASEKLSPQVSQRAEQVIAQFLPAEFNLRSKRYKDMVTEVGHWISENEFVSDNEAVQQSFRDRLGEYTKSLVETRTKQYPKRGGTKSVAEYKTRMLNDPEYHADDEDIDNLDTRTAQANPRKLTMQEAEEKAAWSVYEHENPETSTEDYFSSQAYEKENEQVAESLVAAYDNHELKSQSKRRHKKFTGRAPGAVLGASRVSWGGKDIKMQDAAREHKETVDAAYEHLMRVLPLSLHDEVDEKTIRRQLHHEVSQGTIPEREVVPHLVEQIMTAEIAQRISEDYPTKKLHAKDMSSIRAQVARNIRGTDPYGSEGFFDTVVQSMTKTQRDLEREEQVRREFEQRHRIKQDENNKRERQAHHDDELPEQMIGEAAEFNQDNFVDAMGNTYRITDVHDNEDGETLVSVTQRRIDGTESSSETSLDDFQAALIDPESGLVIGGSDVIHRIDTLRSFSKESQKKNMKDWSEAKKEYSLDREIDQSLRTLELSQSVVSDSDNNKRDELEHETRAMRIRQGDQSAYYEGEDDEMNIVDAVDLLGHIDTEKHARLEKLKSHPDKEMIRMYRPERGDWKVLGIHIPGTGGKLAEIRRQKAYTTALESHMTRRVKHQEKADEIENTLLAGNYALLENFYRGPQWAWHRAMQQNHRFNCWVDNQKLLNEKNNTGVARWVKRQGWNLLSTVKNVGPVSAAAVVTAPIWAPWALVGGFFAGVYGAWKFLKKSYKTGQGLTGK